jgi:hypothetical protein
MADVLNPEVAHGQWASIRGGHWLVPMSDGKVLDWVYGDGSWRLWNYDPKNTHDIFPGAPAAHGQWASIRGNDHWLIPMIDGKVLHWVEGNGSWELWNYDPKNTHDILPGPPAAQGQWATIRTSHRLIPLAPDWTVLDYDQSNGEWRLWNYDPSSKSDIFPGPAIASGKWHYFGSNPRVPPNWWDITLRALPDGAVLDWVPNNGFWRVWEQIPPFPGPLANGQWASIRSGHNLISMHDDNVLDWVASDGSWRLWRYAKPY